MRIATLLLAALVAVAGTDLAAAKKPTAPPAARSGIQLAHPDATVPPVPRPAPPPIVSCAVTGSTDDAFQSLASRFIAP
jgi:hypothetical protein